LAAAISFYTVFSLAPLLVIVIAVVGLAFGQEAAQGQVVGQIQGLVGPDAARMIEEMIEGARRPAAGIFATALGLGILLLGAAGVFGQLQEALNRIWDAPSSPQRRLLGLLHDRFLSFAMLLGTGFLLLVSLVVSAALQALGTVFGRWLPSPLILLEGLHLVLSLAVITVLFALIYKILPQVRIQWRDVWVGAALTAGLFVLGKFLIGLYLGRGSFTSAFGAAGSLVVILLWVYYSAQILLFGAEFTHIYAIYAHPQAHAAAAMSTTEDMRRTPRHGRDRLRGLRTGWIGYLTGLAIGYLTAKSEKTPRPDRSA
jgi:membrane protein